MSRYEIDPYDPDYDGSDFDPAAALVEATSLLEKGDDDEAMWVLEKGERAMKRWEAWKEFDARQKAIEAVLREAWSKTTQKVPVRPKQTRVTLRLDEDVAKWFRRLGPNYGRRVNAVLRDYAILEGFRARR
ncbi:BrnA antitoxin of type II toxin-antitoxin system [Albimonas donghaensis]|uniref:BrnA antitoxin of type II toxin-antitoxin system n=1 Tax=Albimonas donghaensis TaxID=356660 RepID=A0A1H2YIX1_9RHOB|nr:BrnA antitoxin family protein [Albimonas donghaensis]SDX04931.1 BrnA antitoxin of type II toxin-antitoxin system [Albimonas donghaensis]